MHRGHEHRTSERPPRELHEHELHEHELRDHELHEHELHEHAGHFRAFRRARVALWLTLAALAPLGAYFHDLTHHSAVARLIWTVIVVSLLGYPLLFLFGFRCPRCGGVYLSTGKLRDFLGIGRILWATRCGICSLSARG